MAGYSRARASWVDYPDVTTLVRAQDINLWDQSIYDLKHEKFLVTDYGTMGGSDDATTIQATIDAANAAGGGVAQLPMGSFVSSQINLKAKVLLRGMGRNQTTLKLKNGANSSFLQSVGQNDVEIADLTVDGNKANQTVAGGSGAIRPVSVARFSVRNVRVINAYDSSYYANGSSDLLVIGSSFESNGPGAIPSGNIASLRFDSSCTSVRIIGNVVDTPYVHGIAFGSSSTAFTCIGNIVRNPVSSGAIGIATAGGTDNTIADNYITSALTDGNCIDIGDSVNCTIRGNVCVGGRTGIDWDSGTNTNRGNKNTIIGNIVNGCALIGIAAGGTNNAGNGRDAVIIGNVVSGCNLGISLDGIINGIISDNLVKNPTAANPAIKLLSTFKSSTGFVISGNRCYDDQGSPLQTYGLQSVGSCDFLTVYGNDFRDNVTNGLSLVGTNNTVRNNKGWTTENGGTSTQTPGAVASASIAHSLSAAPTNYLVNSGDTNARGAPSMFLTADATNLILNFSSNLAGGTSYTWRWRAEV